ncbi:hypothetical protein P0E69_09490 [Chimaeribacter arupi]|uniref:Uncharacterized protein n=2 Tax=Yersiniaceae TaxID=1903411 RepID=A0ABS5JEN2_9GAMM|nr:MULTISPECIES: hypothetical protein [Yersiniaceae]MBS0967728.1 hypothetical protein [Nissabacter archeti]MDV5140835.1 hypothetical protein [Chimaeribacter arupi]WKZ94077.1 hypothetical protein P0E69_09490 [Chimaeribacter arupi]
MMSNVISLEPYTAKARDIQTGKDFRDWLITTVASIKAADPASEDLKLDACEGIHKLFDVLIEATEHSSVYSQPQGRGKF